MGDRSGRTESFDRAVRLDADLIHRREAIARMRGSASAAPVSCAHCDLRDADFPTAIFATPTSLSRLADTLMTSLPFLWLAIVDARLKFEAVED
jgi:hypothetical protein